MTYIDREQAIENLKDFATLVVNPTLMNVEDAVYILEEMSEANVTEVRHGYWEKDLFCSVCGYLYDTGEYKNSHNYCPKCGAKMDLKD